MKKAIYLVCFGLICLSARAAVPPPMQSTPFTTNTTTGANGYTKAQVGTMLPLTNAGAITMKGTSLSIDAGTVTFQGVGVSPVNVGTAFQFSANGASAGGTGVTFHGAYDGNGASVTNQHLAAIISGGTNGYFVATVTSAGNTNYTFIATNVTGAAGASLPSVFFGTGDPNGVVMATRPATFYTDAGDIWVKTSSGANNTGWAQTVAAP